MPQLSRIILASLSGAWGFLILGCEDAGNKQQGQQPDGAGNQVARQRVEQAKPEPAVKPAPTQVEKADRSKFEGLLRALRSVESDIEQGTTREALDLHIRRLSTELKLLTNQVRTNPEVSAYNQCVEAVDAYQASNALWLAKNMSAQAWEHYAKTKATVGMTTRQLEAMQNGSTMVRVASVNFTWDLSSAVAPYGLRLSTIDGVTFAPAGAVQTIWKHAVAATDEAEGLLR